MYRKEKERRSSLKVNESYEGESIEAKIRRVTQNKEPITDGAPLVYTNRSEGVKPEHNIRTDRFELAVEAMDKVSKSLRAQRDNLPSGKEAKEGMKKEAQSGGESSSSEAKPQS